MMIFGTRGVGLNKFQVVTRMFKPGHSTLALAKIWPIQLAIVPLAMFFYVANIFCTTNT